MLLDALFSSFLCTLDTCTYITFVQCCTVTVGVAQAHPNYMYNVLSVVDLFIIPHNAHA